MSTSQIASTLELFDSFPDELGLTLVILQNGSILTFRGNPLAIMPMIDGHGVFNLYALWIFAGDRKSEGSILVVGLIWIPF